MYTLAVSIHLIVCFLMIAAILLQAGKGAEIGASFGGASQTVFGSRGPGTFLSKVTVAAAAVFMMSSLSLALLSKQQNTSSTVIDLHPTTHNEATTSPSKDTTSVIPSSTPETPSTPVASPDATAEGSSDAAPETTPSSPSEP